MLARLAADLAAQATPVVLVLDSVSVLNDRQLAEDLDALLRHADQHLRMILVGRWDPPLPLYRYRLAGTLTEVRGDDLAFTAEETAALLAAHGVVLSDPALRSLVERTEGWAAGLRLFAMALEGRGEAEDLVATIAGDDANIAEYFVGEVLSAQPPEIRDFLLRTSVVEFTPELAEVLTGRGGARHTLAALERANAFVQPVAKHSAVHRYHRLFAELLRVQLAYEEPTEPPRLHRLAAAWFVAHGRTSEAIRHAVAAGDWAHASALVVQDMGVGRLVAGGDADRLDRLFRDMPAEVVGPEPAAVMAALRFAGDDPDEGAKHLARTEGLVDGSTSPQTVPLRLAAALLGAVAANQRHDAPEALAAADAAEALMAQAAPERVAAHPELRALMLHCRGASQIWTGELDAGDPDAVRGRQGRPAVPSCDRPRFACMEQLALAHIYLGRLRDAADVAGKALELAKPRGRAPARPSFAATAALAWVAAERWDATVAWQHLRAADAIGDDGDDPVATVTAALVRSRLLGGRGELRGAARVLTEARTVLRRPGAAAVARAGAHVGPGPALRGHGYAGRGPGRRQRPRRPRVRPGRGRGRRGVGGRWRPAPGEQIDRHGRRLAPVCRHRC